MNRSASVLETEDFIGAKDKLNARFGLDDYMVGIVTKWLREEVPTMRRRETADDLIDAASDKDNPVGWIRTVIERGTALSALRAHERRKVRSEARPAGEFRRSEVRRALPDLYERKSGSTLASKHQDDDGGMDWKTFASKAPRLSKVIAARIGQLVLDTHEEIEEDGLLYSRVTPPDWDAWLKVIDEFDLAQDERERVGIEVADLSL